MKKFAIAMMVLSLGLFSFVGCGGEDTTTKKTDKKTTEKKDEKKTDDKAKSEKKDEKKDEKAP